MSARNTRAAKARRRKDRTRRDQRQGSRDSVSFDPLADVHTLPELVDLARRGASLPCGCDAHTVLHEMLAGLEDE